MAGPIPRPKRNSTRTTPAPAPSPTAGAALYADRDHSGDTLDVALEDLCPNPFNKREMKGVAELAATIREVGLLQDIAHIRADVWLATYPETAEHITRPNVILFGEHRWRAFRLLERKTIPSVLRDDKVADARLITLVENLRRAQLAPLEEAAHYQALRESGLSYEQIADKVGETAAGTVSKGTVWKRVQLLGLTPEAQDALRDGTLKVSAAEKLQKLTDDDQREALALVRAGVHPVEAQARVLARQRQAGDPLPAASGTVSNGNASVPTKERAHTVSTGNALASADVEGPVAVSDGNGDRPPSQDTALDTPGASGQTVTTSVPARRAVPEQPAADGYEHDRRDAAAARDAACRRLLEEIDVRDSSSDGLLVRVLTAAALAPPQHAAAQQRALVWLRGVGRHGVEASGAGAYFDAVQESGEGDLRCLVAFAMALAACELRTSGRRQRWGSRERDHVRVLREFARYVPGTEWERKELGVGSAETTGEVR